MIEEAICANVIKSVIFNGKVSYRIVRMDSVTDDTVLASDTQEITMKDNHEENSNITVVTEDTQVSLEQQQRNCDYDIATFMEKFRSSLDLTETRFLKIEDHLIGLSCSKSTVNSNSRDTSNGNFYTGLLKNRISKLEKQLADKNAIIEFLSAQIISKPPDKTCKDSSDNYRYRSNDNDRLVTNRNNQDGAPNEKSSNDERSKEVIVIGDSMLNNVNSRGLSKSKNVEVINFPGATSTDIVENIDEILENQKSKSLFVHVGTNDLTNDVNLLNNVKNIVNKTKKKSPNTVLTFSNTIVRKDKKNLEKLRTDANARLKSYCAQKKLSLINHDNTKESHLGIKKLHPNRKGNSLFAKHLLSFIESN